MPTAIRAFVPRRHVRLAISMVMVCASIAALAAGSWADRGRWTTLQDLDPNPAVTNDLAIHLTLQRGDGTYHSRVLWWGHQGAVGGVRGWNPGNDDCAATPLSTLPAIGTWNPGADIFCGGMCTLAGGEFLSIGGTDKNGSWGIPDARTYDSGAGVWTPRALMKYSRFYPTATLLKDGRVLSSWGQRYGPLWLFGGRRDGAAPNGATGDSVLRTGRGTGAIWDPSVKPDPSSVGERPPPREGQTAASMTYNGLAGVAIFGGRDENGNTVDDRTWHLHREDGGPLDADYTYRWDKVDVSSLPLGRAEHIAVTLSSTEMVIFGGVRKPTGGSATVTGEFWHLWRNNAAPPFPWTWSQVQTSGAPPTARYGHAAVYVNGRKLYVFGGSEQWNQAPTDTKVYLFTFNHPINSPASGTWSELPIAAGPGPGPRRGHTMVYDATGPTGPALLVFGGYLNGTGGDSALWKLDLNQSPAVWSTIPTSGASPGARAGHAAFYENSNVFNGGRMILYGGDPVGGGSSDAYVYTIEPFASGGAVWARGPSATARLSGHTMLQDPTAVMARNSEVYDPTADRWTDTQASLLQTRPAAYAVHFVVPGAPAGGGGRVLAVGPDQVARYIEVDANGQAPLGWRVLTNGNSGFEALTGVSYLPGTIMIAGGVEDPTGARTVTGLTKTLDASGTTGWQASASMAPRYHHNLVVLPTGEVLAMGGVTTASEDGQLCCGVKTPQLWDPGSRTWSDTTAGVRLAPDEAERNYHSAALLLPDGRVLSGGGDRDAPWQDKVNIFCPPYLFQANGAPAVRPVINSVPGSSISYGQTFLIGTPTPGAITTVCLMHPGATTHSFDQNQRYVPLGFSSIGPSTLRALAPLSGAHAPPGDYLLFILSNGVPSIAKWVRLGNCPSIPCDVDAPPIVSLSADIVGPNEVWLVWSAPGDDRNPALGVYDLRFSASPITSEDAFAAASAMPVSGNDQTPPLPGTVGAPQGCAKFGLAACTPYYFALKTKDGALNWSPMSPFSITTTCGGPGGGESAHRAREEGDGPAAGPPGQRSATQVANAAAGLEAVEGAPVEALSTTGSGVLVAETDRTAQNGWQVTLRMVAKAEGLDPALEGMFVSQIRDDMSGGWTTLGRHQVSPDQSPLGLCALRDKGRVVFPAGYVLGRVVTGLRANSGDYSAHSASHSRLGDLDERSLATDGAVEMLVGDMLTIVYAPSADAVAGAAGWYLLVRPGGPTATPAHRTPLPTLPTRFDLRPNQPNPAQRSTRIAFDLPVASDVAVEVFDLLGRRVTTLVEGKRPAGRHAVEWDLRDGDGTKIRPGVYVCRMVAGEFRSRIKISVVPSD
jgi:hypothetical protein